MSQVINNRRRRLGLVSFAIFLTSISLLVGIVGYRTWIERQRDTSSRALLKAVADMDVIAAKRALSSGADPNCRYDDASLTARPTLLSLDWWRELFRLRKWPRPTGLTALMKAADNQDAAMLETLLISQASPDLVTTNAIPRDPWPEIEQPEDYEIGGYTALAISCRHGNAVCVQILLKYRADPNIARSDGRTPMQLAVGRSVVRNDGSWDWENQIKKDDLKLEKNEIVTLLRSAGARR